MSLTVDEPSLQTRRCSLRVDDDFFDPEGVRQLQRRLSRSLNYTQLSTSSPSITTPTKSDESVSVESTETFDLKKTLDLIVSRQKAENIKARTLGVAFEDLSVSGLGASSSFQPTIGTLFDPAAILNALQTIRYPPLKTILTGFEGVVRPGEMLLVLGSPGSGCTTLLKVLANHRAEYHTISGTVYYDSLSPKAVEKQYRGDVVYCPEDDIHFPSLTVQETLGFASKMRAPHNRIDQHTRAQYMDVQTDVLMTVFGLKHARYTVVGDESIRGVSGGEKKRVSIAENLASRCRIGSWDNSTRGLDSSTALEFVRALRMSTDASHVTTIVSIYQAGESLYHLFDKVCLIYQGRMAYFGPADRARQYFVDLGFVPAERQTTADFLVSITDPTARVVREGTHVPRTADEFASSFLSSDMGKLNRADIKHYKTETVDNPELVTAYDQSFQDEKANHTRRGSPYTVSVPMQVKAVLLRRIEILKGSWLILVINLMLFVVQAIIMGTVFLRSPEATSAYYSRGGILFFALLFAALASMAEIPALYGQRPIIARHERAALCHPATEALALTLVDIPITFSIIGLFCIILYFLVRLQQSAEQFFVFFLFVFVMAITMKAWFRTLAAAFKDEATAQTFAGISILILSIYTGYIIPKPSMIGGLRWITYVNPLRFGFESIMTNEFRTLNGLCSNLIPSGPGYENISIRNQVCSTAGSLPGQVNVDGARFVQVAYGYSWSHTWMNFGILLAYCIGFILTLLIFTECNISSFCKPSIILFKRGTRNHINVSSKACVADAEKPPSTNASPKHSSENGSTAESQTGIDHPQRIFSWEKIEYSVEAKGAQKKILGGISGYVAPGKLTALMGESGAGKTTLLNVLSQRTTGGTISGDRLIDGSPLPKDFQSQTGYVQQMDTHMPLQTVREALLFSARMRQPSHVPDYEKQAYVDHCLRLCGLQSYAHAMVGSLSIEHRKRTTIGVELAAKPQLLLFLDEPTSGLDSQSAWAIMSFLRSLADSGQAILCTIHQPSSELFQVFDRLLLLRKGGQTVYFGDIGENSSKMIRYFQEQGARDCTPDENPAEYMLDVIGAGATALAEQEWGSIWESSPEAQAVETELGSLRQQRADSSPSPETQSSTPSWPFQLQCLLARNVSSYWRDPVYILAKMALNIVGGLFIGFTFLKAKNSQQGIQNQLFSIFMATVLAAPLSNQIQVPFINIRSIYEVRERSSRMYSWSAMLTAQILVELPWNIAGSTLFFVCWYWTVGFPADRAGYTYLMYGIMFPMYYTTIAQAVAAMAPTADIAALLFSFFFSFVLTFNGVLQPYRELGWWKWMYRLSPFTYLIEGLLGQAIGRQEVQCSPVEYVTVVPPSGISCSQYMDTYIRNFGGYLERSTNTFACTFCPFRTTDQYLAYSFNISYDHHWRNFGVMFGFIAFNVAAIFFFTYVCRIRKWS